MRLGDLDEVVNLVNSYKTGSIAKSELLWSLSQEPTIDAVPVVRCKDCSFCTFHKGVAFCIKWRPFPEVSLDDFCSHGERKDGEG